MTINLPPAPAVTSQRVDRSGFIASTGASAHAMCAYSLKGSIKLPMELSTVDSLDSQAGRPNAAISFAHYGARYLLAKGLPVYFQRVVNGATYGGSVVLSDAADNTVTFDTYPTSGSLFPADPDPSTGIAPTGPGYIALTFNGPLVTANVINLNVVMDSAIVAISPVTFASNNDATLTALAAAIQTAMSGAGSDGRALVMDNDPTSSVNARTIGIFAPSGQSIAITGVLVTSGTTQVTSTQQTPLFYVQAENPGAWSQTVGYFLTNADVGVKEVIQLTYATSIGAVSTTTFTINSVACTEVTYATSSDATMAAVAAAIAAHPDVDTATVTNKPLGNDNDRVITIKMLRGSSTDTVITHVDTGSMPSLTITQIVKGVDPTGAFDLEVYTSDNPTIAVETHRVSIAAQTDNYGVQQQIDYVVNEGDNSSGIIRVIPNAPNDGSVIIPFDPTTGDISSSITWLSAGSDGALPTASQIAAAWSVFNDTELYSVSTLVNTGYTSASIQQAIGQVALTRNDGANAILDIPSNVQKTAQTMLAYRLTQMPIDTSYSASYYPDVQMQDPYTGKNLWIPNSAHMAAVYAANDASRGIGGAPAGLRVGQVDTSAIRYNYASTDHDMLFTAQLNSIQQIGSAFYVMGDTTLQYAQSALSFVSISRLVGFLQGKMQSASKFYLFEGNTDTTAFALVTAITKFLQPYKPSDLNDFSVVSGIGDNTSGLIEQGDRIVDVILDPVRSIRRLLVRTVITATGGISSIDVSEL